ncbi:MAG: hypothetical protein QOI98_81 [Solirubrobacteraceae bacterium]|jgi:hypothetical protein|nr:hypothetical protein [Solirubrobacteraceae bacterium]
MTVVRQGALATAVLIVTLTAGCGGSGSDQSPQEKAARETVTAWGHADTPAKACALMHDGFKRAQFGDAARCESRFVDKLGAPGDEKLTIKTVTLKAGQAVVVAKRPNGVQQTYYLMHASQSDTTWKVAGLGIPPPPAP